MTRGELVSSRRMVFRRFANRVGLALLATLAFAAALFAFSSADRLVSDVVVEGTLDTTHRAQVAAVLRGLESERLLSLDLQGARERILSLGWPAAVSLRRVWPSTLIVRVDKESTVAAWGDGHLLTGSGRLVPVATQDVRLPGLFSPQTSPGAVLELYQRMTQALAEAGLAIDSLVEDELGQWTLTLRDGLVVYLGRSGMESRVREFARSYPRLVSSGRRAEYIDMRYRNAVAVKWRASLVADAPADHATRSFGRSED